MLVRLTQSPPTLDPARIVDLDGARIAAKLFNGLVAFGETLEPVPDIAASWAVSADGRTYTFTLKPGVRFFNGRPVSAGDFVYSFRRVLSPETRSPRTWVLSRIRGAREFMEGKAGTVTGMRAPDNMTLVLHLKEPFAPFINFLGLTTAYVVPREEVDKWGADYGFHASGTGPFALQEWRHNQHILVRRNDFYFGEKPRLSGIRYDVIPEDFTALVSFEKSDIDLLPEIMPAAYDRYRSDPRWAPHISSAPALNTYYLGLNCQKPPFTDVRVRRALNYAIDRKTILETVMQSRGTLARGPLPPGLRQGPAPQGYAYDPVAARDLLAQAGYPDGFEMSIYQAADLENLYISQTIQQYLKKVGITARIVQLEWSGFLEAVSRGEAQAFWLSWWADYPDAENFLFPLFHSRNWGPGGNRSRFKNDKIDRRIEQAVTIGDPQKRAEAYADIERRIVDQAPWVFFWHKSVCSLHRPRVRGFSPQPLAVMEKGVDIAVR